MCVFIIVYISTHTYKYRQTERKEKKKSEEEESRGTHSMLKNKINISKDKNTTVITGAPRL